MVERSESDTVYEVNELHLGLTDGDWAKVFAFKKKYAERAGKPLKHDSIGAVKEKYTHHLNAGFKLFLVWENDSEFGLVILYRKKKFGEKIIFMKHDFISPNLNQELFKAILNQFLSSCSSAESLVMTSNDSRNDYIEEVLKLEISEVRELFELEIKQVSENLLSNWINNGLENNNELEVIFKSELPNQVIDDYYTLIRELNNDVTYRSSLFDDSYLASKQLMNLHDLYKERGINHLTSLLFEKNGNNLVGYTEMTIEPSARSVAIQNMTGVKSFYRGRGLGKLLKASMLRRMKEMFPEVSMIKTAIHLKNTPSQKLNRQLGFQKVGVYKEYIIPRSSIVNYLNRL